MADNDRNTEPQDMTAESQTKADGTDCGTKAGTAGNAGNSGCGGKAGGESAGDAAGTDTARAQDTAAGNKAGDAAGADSTAGDKTTADGTAADDTVNAKDGTASAEDRDSTAGSDQTADGGESQTESDAAEQHSDGGSTAKADKKDKQIQELNDKYVRLFAEFDNYRKRTENEKLGMFAEGEKTVLLKILPLIDNFERAIQSIPEEQKGTALSDGIEKTYSSFMAQLAELGVTAIEAKDKPFDANLHNAVMHIEDDGIPENTVVEEFQKGYMFKDKVLRYSMVKVAN